LIPVVASSVFLFYAGVLFAYFAILPISINFLLTFGTQHLQPLISGEHYFAFVLRLALAFGVVFQFPLVVAVLTYWEVLAPDFLARYWRYGVITVFVLSALLTPPDVTSQLLMAGPVLVLYFVSMGVAKAIARARVRSGDGSD
jgi:sec-independent protein translocase protein TatC